MVSLPSVSLPYKKADQGEPAPQGEIYFIFPSTSIINSAGRRVIRTSRLALPRVRLRGSAPRGLSCLRLLADLVSLGGVVSLQTRVEPPPSGRADTLAPHVAIPRVVPSSSPGRPSTRLGAEGPVVTRRASRRGAPTSRPLAGTTEPPPLPHWGAGSSPSSLGGT